MHWVMGPVLLVAVVGAHIAVEMTAAAASVAAIVDWPADPTPLLAELALLAWKS